MKLLDSLRALVYLRRLARAAESQAESLATLARLAVQEYQVKPARKAVFGVFDEDAAAKEIERRRRGEEPAA